MNWKPIIVLISLSTAALAVIAGQLRTTITLEWDYPTNEVTSDLVFNVYSTTNGSAVVSNWPLVATISGTNRSVTLPIAFQQCWFVLRASNWWGESSPSNVAGTPPIPSDSHGLRIGP